MDIIENNKRIAKFMGVKPHLRGPHEEYEMYQVLECIEDGPDEQHFFTPDDLKFHESWDWLIPVVEKINSFRNKDNQKIYTIETSFSGGVTLMVRFCDEDNDPTAHYRDENTFKALYTAVIEFINWYNKQ